MKKLMKAISGIGKETVLTKTWLKRITYIRNMHLMNPKN